MKRLTRRTALLITGLWAGAPFFWGKAEGKENKSWSHWAMTVPKLGPINIIFHLDDFKEIIFQWKGKSIKYSIEDVWRALNADEGEQ